MSDFGRRAFFRQSFAFAGVLFAGRLAQASASVTPSQTSGPFIPYDFPFSEPNEGRPYLIVEDSNIDLTQIEGRTGTDGRPLIASGQVLYLRGQVVDQAGTPVPGASVYLWQADEHGHYNHMEDSNVRSAADLDPNFQYRGFIATDSRGGFQFKTIKPKYYPLEPGGSLLRTAHLHIAVLHPSCRPLVTQTYFEGGDLEEIEKIRSLNAQDIILAPRGRILDQFRSLIVEYRQIAGYGDGPVGDVKLVVTKLG